MKTKTKKNKKGAVWALGRVAKDLLQVKYWLLALVLCSVGIIVCNALSPDLLGKIIGSMNDFGTGKITKESFLQGLPQLLLSLLIVYLLYGAFSIGQAFCNTNMTTNNITAGKRIQMADKISRLPIPFLDKLSSGELISRVHHNVSTLGNNISETVSVFISGGLQMIVMVAVILAENAMIAGIVVLLTPISAILSTLIAQKSAKYYNKLWEQYDRIYEYAAETFGGLETMKNFSAEGCKQADFVKISERLGELQAKANFISSMVQPVVSFVNHLSFIVVCLLGGYLSVKGRMSVETVVTLVLYSKQFSQPLTLIANGFSSVQLLGSSAKKVYDFLDEAEMTVETPALGTPVRGEVKFEDVGFAYVEGKPVVEGLTLTAAAGERVAIVGPTGGGKTTLVNLLMRFYEPQKGRILLDGQDIAAFNRENLRENVSMVLQDTWLSTGTVAENIAYGKANATREEVVAAAKQAYADRFISLLPNGYDTVLTERTALSGGQKQLLTIARAFLSDKPVLILDEATSDVDTRTELYVQKAMDRLQSKKTCFVIAHRLSTIVHADKIVAIDHGKIVDMGKHEELLQKGGFYADLWRSQYQVG